MIVKLLGEDLGFLYNEGQTSSAVEAIRRH